MKRRTAHPSAAGINPASAALSTASPSESPGVASPAAMTARAGHLLPRPDCVSPLRRPDGQGAGDFFDGNAAVASPVSKHLPGMARGETPSGKGAPAARSCRGISRERQKAERKSQRRKGDARLLTPRESAARSPLRSAITLLALSLAAQLHDDRAIAGGAHDLAVDELVRAFDESPDLMVLTAKVERLAPRWHVARGLREGWLAPVGVAP